MRLTDQELQSLRNLGCEFEQAADEIVELRAAIAAAVAVRGKPVIWVQSAQSARIGADRYELVRAHDHETPEFPTPLYAHPAPAEPSVTAAAMDALRRLWPLIERGTRGFVFTADKAGEVAADMAALRAAMGDKP
jgi:hypothetical protein